MKKGVKLCAFARNMLTAIVIMMAAVLLCIFLKRLEVGDASLSAVFVLAVFLVSRLTAGYAYGIAASFLAVVCVNYVFTYPYFELNFTISGYPVTFMVFLAVAVITSAMTTQIKRSESLRAEAEKEKMRGNLLRAISHDVRTPLTGIFGAAAAILEQEDTMPPQKRREMLRGICDDAEWMIRMVENLLSVTRISSGQTKIIKTDEAAEEVIAAALMAFRKRNQTMRVHVSVPDELLIVPMDAILIRQVLVNLLENAAQHGGEGAEAWLSASREGSEAVFLVKDNGRGIREDAIRRIFDGLPEKDESRTADSSRGMGIGLSVCRTIVKAHGGTLCAGNQKTGGACFRFALPLTEETACPSKM